MHMEYTIYNKTCWLFQKLCGTCTLWSVEVHSRSGSWCNMQWYRMCLRTWVASQGRKRTSQAPKSHPNTQTELGPDTHTPN